MNIFQIEKAKINQTQIEPIYQIIFSRTFNCDMIDDDFIKELYKGLDFLKMKKRNEQMTKHIRQLIKTDPQEKYLFAVGAGCSSSYPNSFLYFIFFQLIYSVISVSFKCYKINIPMIITSNKSISLVKISPISKFDFKKKTF